MSCLAIFRDWRRAAALGATLGLGHATPRYRSRQDPRSSIPTGFDSRYPKDIGPPARILALSSSLPRTSGGAMRSECRCYGFSAQRPRYEGTSGGALSLPVAWSATGLVKQESSYSSRACLARFVGRVAIVC